MSGKIKSVNEETRKILEDAILALGSLDTRHLVWLTEAAVKAIATKIEAYELSLIRLDRTAFSDKPFVSDGFVTEREAPKENVREERKAKYMSWLESEYRLLDVALKLKKAASQLSAEEFGDRFRDFFKSRLKGE